MWGRQTLDLNGHTIRCIPDDPKSSVSIGVDVIGGVDNKILGPGAITGCFIGVQGVSTKNLKIKDIDFSGNTYIGINLAESESAEVLNSKFNDISGYAVEAYSIGINSVGSNAVIKNNSCANLARQPDAPSEIPGEGVCILMSADTHGNRIESNRLLNDEVGPNIGIWVGEGGTNHIISNNQVSGFGRGIISSKGASSKIIKNSLYLNSPLKDSIGIAANAGCHDSNTIVGFDTKILGSINEC